MLSIKFGDKEIQNPVLRALAATSAIVIATIVFLVVIVLSPLLVLVHMALRYFGRRGFAYSTWDHRGEHLHIDISPEAFKVG